MNIIKELNKINTSTVSILENPKKTLAENNSGQQGAYYSSTPLKTLIRDC
jgi:hypothetical protein